MENATFKFQLQNKWSFSEIIVADVE